VAKFQQLYEQTPVMHITMALFDGVLKIVQCNRRLQDALGYGHVELIGMPYADLLAPDTRAGRSLTSNIDKVLAGEVILQSRILLAKDGSRVVVLAHVALTPDTLNGVRTARATMVDIGDNIAVRNALLNAEQTFQKLIELVPQLVVVHDLQGRTVWCNRQFEASFWRRQLRSLSATVGPATCHLAAAQALAGAGWQQPAFSNSVAAHSGCRWRNHSMDDDLHRHS
jgi:PAS domain S-box-containing protein